MTFCWKCPEADCEETAETSNRELVPTCWGYSGEEPHGKMIRDYKAESAGVDRFALRNWGTRWARREPLGPAEAHKYNRERTER